MARVGEEFPLACPTCGSDIRLRGDGRQEPGEPLEREGGPGARAQQVFETPKIAGHVAVDKRDPDAGVDGKPAVLPGEHVGGGPLYEPLINSKVAAEVPLAGLSFIDRATLYPSERMAICPSTNW
jgi:hypothetical protein